MSAFTEPDARSADPSQPIDADQTLSELVSRMTNDVGKLIGTQIELAKVEIKDEARRAGKGAGMIGGGGLAACLGVVLVSVAVAYWLADALGDLGTGFLVVGLIYAVAAAVLILKGKQHLKSVTPIAGQTIETIKEDVEWARQQRT